jgi:hypothetical protein
LRIIYQNLGGDNKGQKMHDTQELENKTLQILKAGYMPVDNKNLIAFATIATLWIVSSAATLKIGYDLKASEMNGNLTTLASYGELEANIINNYEKRHGIASIHAAEKIPIPYSYIDKSGFLQQITTTPPRVFLT